MFTSHLLCKLILTNDLSVILKNISSNKKNYALTISDTEQSEYCVDFVLIYRSKTKILFDSESKPPENAYDKKQKRSNYTMHAHS